jgi:hypothetical protein
MSNQVDPQEAMLAELANINAKFAQLHALARTLNNLQRGYAMIVITVSPDGGQNLQTIGGPLDTVIFALESSKLGLMLSSNRAQPGQGGPQPPPPVERPPVVIHSTAKVNG